MTTTITRVSGPAGLIHVDDGGRGGIPVLFVHSFAGTSNHWVHQLLHLRTGRRAVAMDLRGHGQSDPPPRGDYAVTSLATDIAAVVDALALARVVLVGHSLGGQAALAYAGAHQDRVQGLVLVATPGKIPPDRARQTIAGLESDYDKVTKAFWDTLLTGARPDVEKRVRAEMNSVPRQPALSLIRATLDFDPLPSLQAYAGPKLSIITPHGDTPTDLHNLVSGLPHEVMRGTSHWPHLDAPDEFNRLLDRFLASVEVAPHA